MRAVLTSLLVITILLGSSERERPTLGLILPERVEAVAESSSPLGEEQITPENAARVDTLARWGNGDVRRIVYSADGRLLVVGTAVGVAIYDAATLVQQRFIETGRHVQGLSVAADGSLVAASTTSRELGTRLWRVVDGELLGRVEGTGEVALSSDGRYMATQTGRTVYGVWHVADLTPVRELAAPDDRALTSLEFSFDGAVLAAGAGSPDTVIWLWRVADGALVQSLVGHTSFVRQIDFAPDGQALTSISEDRSARTWNVANGTVARVRTFDGNARLSFGLDVLLVWRDGRVWLEREADGTTLAEIPPPVPTRNSVIVSAFSPDGGTVAIGRTRDDVGVRLWRVPDGAPLGKLEEYFDLLGQGWLSPDGQTLAIGDGGVARVRRLGDGAVVNAVEGGRVIWFSPDGQVIASVPPAESGVSTVKITLRRLSDGAPLGAVTDDMPLAFSPDGALLAASSGVWRVADGTLLRKIESPTDLSTATVAFTPDGSSVAYGWGDGSLSLFRVQDAALLGRWDGHRGPEIRGRTRRTLALAFSPDGAMLLSGGQDATARLWRLPDGMALGTLSPHLERIFAVAFTPDGRLALLGTQYGPLLLWNVGDGNAPAARPIVLDGHTEQINWIGVAADGRMIVTSSTDGTIRFWGMR